MAASWASSLPSRLRKTNLTSGKRCRIASAASLPVPSSRWKSITTMSGDSSRGTAPAPSTEVALPTTSMSPCPSSSMPRLSEPSWRFSTMTTLMRRSLLPSRGRAGGSRRSLTWLIAGSGQVGPPGDEPGFQLLYKQGRLRTLVVVGQAQAFTECAKPAANLFEAVDRLYVQALGRQRGQTLPPDLGPLPCVCPPAGSRTEPAAPRSHTGLHDRPGSATFRVKIPLAPEPSRCRVGTWGNG